MVALIRVFSWPIVFVVLTLSSISRANESVPAGYRMIAAEHGIPQSVLFAVALTESGKQTGQAGTLRPWPWTLNVAGRGYFFDSRQAAWQALTAYLKEGTHSIDIGLMQVNWRYHKNRLGTPWQALDPYHNIRVGAGILQDCHATRQDWWGSVGCYHSPKDSHRADRYRRRVVSHWQRIVKEG